MKGTQPETRQPTIADGYRDLLLGLDEEYRRSLIHRLTQGFYEGWRPTRRELAALIAQEAGQTATPTHPKTAPSRAPATASFTPPKPTSTATGPGVRPTRRRRARASTDPQLIAAFQVDCGQLAPRYRFIARSLNSAGTAHRGTELCRLVYLTYELHPLTGPGDQRPTSPVLFTAPIVCFPDHPVPWADSDGRERHHTVTGSRVIGRRGTWPLARNVRRVRFMINQQTPPGIPSLPNPAGTLIIDVGSGRAAWRPV